MQNILTEVPKIKRRRDKREECPNFFPTSLTDEGALSEWSSNAARRIVRFLLCLEGKTILPLSRVDARRLENNPEDERQREGRAIIRSFQTCASTEVDHERFVKLGHGREKVSGRSRRTNIFFKGWTKVAGLKNFFPSRIFNESSVADRTNEI